MKRLMLIVLLLIGTLVSNAQNCITDILLLPKDAYTNELLSSAKKEIVEFMGVPVTGSPQSMASKLTAKGFRVAPEYGPDILEGVFNGDEVLVSLQSHNNLVWRVIVMNKGFYSAAQAKIRYNKLLAQFDLNPKYIVGSEEGTIVPIPEMEDISRNIAIKNYSACFFQKIDNDNDLYRKIAEIWMSTPKVKEQLQKEQLDKLSQKEQFDIMYERLFMWFTSLKSVTVNLFKADNGKDEYCICLFYHNQYNDPHNGLEL